MSLRWESFGAVEKFHRLDDNLNITSRDIWILETCTTLTNGTLGANHVFITKMLGELKCILGLRVDN